MKPNRTEPNRTEPNRTESNRTNRTEPNRTKPNKDRANKKRRQSIARQHIIYQLQICPYRRNREPRHSASLTSSLSSHCSDAMSASIAHPVWTTCGEGSSNDGTNGYNGNSCNSVGDGNGKMAATVVAVTAQRSTFNGYKPQRL